MSLFVLLGLALLLWAVLAVPLAMLVGRLSRGGAIESGEQESAPPALEQLLPH